jgi:hypothetical protein
LHSDRVTLLRIIAPSLSIALLKKFKKNENSLLTEFALTLGDHCTLILGGLFSWQS